MHRLHLTRNLRSVAFLLTTAAILAAVVALWWANHTGLPDSWRAAIEHEISKQGPHVKIGRLSYLPLRGVLASKVRIFSDATHQREISRLESVILGFDKTKLARGKVHLTKVELRDAQLSLPVDPEDPSSKSLDITNAHGTLFMPGNRRLEIRNARGRIAGIDVNLDARLTGDQRQTPSPPDPDQLRKRRELLERILAEIQRWQFDSARPPQLRVFVESDANQSSTLTAKVALAAQHVGRNGYHLDNFAFEAEIAGDLVTLTSLRASDRRGLLDARLDYDVSDREGRFDVHSSLEIPHLLESWFGWPAPAWVRIDGGQTIEAAGGFKLSDDNQPSLHMTGRVRCEDVSLRDVHFDTAATAFSWRGGDLFLRELRLQRADGEARGKAMIQWPLVRVALETTLPTAVCRPFFKNQPLDRVLGYFAPRTGAAVEVKLEGGFNANDRLSWAYAGTASVKNMNFRGVPLNSAECRLSLSHHELDFSDGTVVFNYQDDPLRKAFNGPVHGTAKVGRIRYDHAARLVEVEDVAGEVWAAPLVRLFAAKLAPSLEDYRFHRPPLLRGSGVVDVTPQGRTNLEITFASNAAADYQFLGENLTLERPRGRVVVENQRVQVEDLTFHAFGGPFTTRFDARGKGVLEGELSWSKIGVPELTSSLGFQMKAGGLLTGRVEFSLTNGRLETMDGKGLFALEKSELMSVPMFGPLSPLISGVLNDRRAGFERAKDAFCNFTIQDGILHTNDFHTSTTSLVFAGDGQVDLKERTIDMTMRMNARGLLGLITLPLRPFYGMFQFRGSGPLKNPKWENVMFTAPPAGQSELLLAAPKAKVVAEPR